MRNIVRDHQGSNGKPGFRFLNIDSSPAGVIGGSSPIRSGIFGTNINMNMALGGVQGSPIVSAKALRMTFLVSVDLANKKNSTESIEGEKTEFHQYSCHTH